MIDVKQAVAAATAYVQQFPNLLPTSSVRLEETELTENNKQWHVTLSFLDNVLTGARSHKIFEIDADTGEVKSMKTRSILR
jgi:hypothetical protein